jgi:hypothetical protein
VTTVLDTFLDLAFDGTFRVIEGPWVAFVLFRERVRRFVNQPIHVILYELSHTQWLAEFMLAAPLLLLSVLIQQGFTGAILSRVMPLSIWSAWLFISGGANLVALFSGSIRARYVCSLVFLPWIYGLLLFSFGAVSFTPRRDAAFLVVSFVASIITTVTLRAKNAGS